MADNTPKEISGTYGMRVTNPEAKNSPSIPRFSKEDILMNYDTYGDEYPKHMPLYNQIKPHELTPADHFMFNTKINTNRSSPYYGAVYNNSKRWANTRNTNKAVYLIPGKDHFINDQNVKSWNGEGYNPYDPNDSANIENETPFMTNSGKKAPSFNGSATPINQTNDPDKANVIKFGLENAELNRINNKKAGGSLSSATYKMDTAREYAPPPISPLQPFYRMMTPDAAQTIVNHAYNRFQHPIADVEHRKAFRNLFFTRPECYIMCSEQPGTHNRWGLSMQCENDDDIASSCSRMPHICKMLSPVYITGTFGTNFARDNFNYLISNRVMGFSVPEETLSTADNVGRSVEGYTVTPGMHMESHQGGSFNVTFRDTKHLEVYEYFRIWMIYIAKRKRGLFEPPFARYDYANDFPVSFSSSLSSQDVAFLLHPYDRALEYTASLFDIVTNEANDRIIYWCKYYGIYPTGLSISGLSSDLGAAMASDITVDVTFRYQYKLPCVNKSLVEFNFNAGITNSIGKATDSTNLNVSDGYLNAQHFFGFRDQNINSAANHYIPYEGGGGMFTGTPYIVMGRYNRDVSNANGTGQITVHPFLRFMGVNNKMINNVGNLRYQHTSKLSSLNKAVGID